jgi:apolipoprotein N-acyltransferase
MYDNYAKTYFRELMQKYNLEIFTGFPHFTLAPDNHINDELYYNAAALFKPDGSISELYYKNILVPVGERMLWLNLFPFLWKLQFGQANWEFGNGPAYYQTDSLEFSPSICYELAFAEFHQKMAIRKDKDTGSYKKTDFLVNITNDAWFGTSYGPWLHSVMAKFRAVENRIQIYRSANTGISLIVDPFGRILTKAGLFEITNLYAPLIICPKIPVYRYIYWYPWIFVILVAGLFIYSFLKKEA